MPITIKKPTGGKLVKGRDHILKCVLTWDDDTHPNTDTDVDAYYVSIKSSDALDDDEAIIALNSITESDQFIVSGVGITPANGEMHFWLKKEDQDDIIADAVKYCMDMVVILTDGTEWPFILDYNILFTQPITRETEHGA